MTTGAIVLPLVGAVAAGLVSVIERARDLSPWRTGLTTLALLLEIGILLAGLSSATGGIPEPAFVALGVPLALSPTGALVVLVGSLASLARVTLGGALTPRGPVASSPELGNEAAPGGLLALGGLAILAAAGSSLVVTALTLLVITVALLPLPPPGAPTAIQSDHVAGLPPPREGAGATRGYLTWLGLAGSALLIAGVLDRLYARQPGPGILGSVAGLFVVGIGVSGGALPFAFWLPALCADAPAGAALVVAVLGSATAAMCANAIGADPWVLGDSAARSGLAVVSALGGALGGVVALGEKHPARYLASLIGANAALSLAGLAVSPPGDPAGVVWSFLVQSLAGSLGLVCLTASGGDPRGLARRRPALAAGLGVSVLSLSGVPPTAGFVGRWLVGPSLVAQSVPLALIVAAASVLGGLAAVRAFASMFVQLDQAHRHGAAGPVLVDGVALLLAALLVGAGLWPAPILGLLR